MSASITQFEMSLVTLSSGKTTKLKARGHFVVGDFLKVRFEVYDGKNGLWAKLPSSQGSKPDPKTGFPVQYPQASFVNKEDYSVLNNLVRDKYLELTGESQGKSKSLSNPSQGDFYSDGDIPF